MNWKRCTAVVMAFFWGAPAWCDGVPAKPADMIEWVGEAWTEDGWDASLKKKYMRITDDTGWHVRMIGMQALVRSGSVAVAPLVETLKHGEPGMRIFAAQTLGYLAPYVPNDDLVAALRDEVASVRLYAVDALGMSGEDGLAELLGPMKTPEEDRDVKKHIDYALLRDGTPVDESVIAS